MGQNVEEHIGEGELMEGEKMGRGQPQSGKLAGTKVEIGGSDLATAREGKLSDEPKVARAFPLLRPPSLSFSLPPPPLLTNHPLTPLSSIIMAVKVGINGFGSFLLSL